MTYDQFGFSPGCYTANSNCEITVPGGVDPAEIVISADTMDRSAEEPAGTSRMGGNYSMMVWPGLSYSPAAGRSLSPVRDGKIVYQTGSVQGSLDLRANRQVRNSAGIFLPRFDVTAYCQYLDPVFPRLYEAFVSLTTAEGRRFNRTLARVEAVANKGDYTQAVKIAKTLRADWQREAGLTKVIDLAISKGDYEQATTIANSAGDSFKAETLGKVGRAERSGERFGQAVEAAMQIKDDWEQGKVLKMIGGYMGEVGLVEEAHTLAGTIKGRSALNSFLLGIKEAACPQPQLPGKPAGEPTE